MSKVTLVSLYLHREINRQILLDGFQYMTKMLSLQSELKPIPATASFHSQCTMEIFRKTMSIFKYKPHTPVEKRSPFYQKHCQLPHLDLWDSSLSHSGR